MGLVPKTWLRDQAFQGVRELAVVIVVMFVVGFNVTVDSVMGMSSARDILLATIIATPILLVIITSVGVVVVVVVVVVVAAFFLFLLLQHVIIVIVVASIVNIELVFSRRSRSILWLLFSV